MVMAPMTRNFAPGGVPTEEMALYYGRRAAAEVGLIITEGTVINHKASNGYPSVPEFFGDEALSGWKKVVDEVHKEGGKIVPQIWHVGKVRKKGMEPDPAVNGYGPMEKSRDGDVRTIGMTQQDIDEVVAAYGDAAKAAYDLGFDGVEVHGAHGYLIDQFLWEGTNQRTDEYGGSLEKRTRFAVEVVEDIRRKVPVSFPVIFRFSQWKMTDYSAQLVDNPKELGVILNLLKDAGVDIFHASTRRFWEPTFEGSDLNLAGWAKKLTGLPVITVGSVGIDREMMATFDPKWDGRSEQTDIDPLLNPLSDDQFDLVAVGRALLGDPEWSLKVKEDRLDDVIPFTQKSMEALI
tara:strand:+ start:1094 stop:2140 length:1047 start_codon:yes stop_codon:yes gene_type:complete